MKIPSLRKDNAAKAHTKFVCKECKMVFNTKESLELHKKKSRHFTGLIYFGKHEK
jgi:predicted metal-binding protein